MVIEHKIICGKGTGRLASGQRNRVDIPKDKLIELYVESKLSLNKIGKIFNCDYESVRRRMIESGIERTGEVRDKKGTNKVRHICENCGNEFMVRPSRAKHGRGKFCSPKCQYKSNNKGYRSTTKTIVFRCICCGMDIIKYATRLATKGSGKYCSLHCRNEHRVGKNHPQHIDGKAADKRGANWQKQKRAAKKRDNNICQKCFVQLAAKNMHVHHVMPYRYYKSYLDANKLENLITLCESCHRKDDAVIQRKEREAGITTFKFL